jgi:hypothetical protein
MFAKTSPRRAMESLDLPQGVIDADTCFGVPIATLIVTDSLWTTACLEARGD